jgi:hypothetical protein
MTTVYTAGRWDIDLPVFVFGPETPNAEHNQRRSPQ